MSNGEVEVLAAALAELDSGKHKWSLHHAPYSGDSTIQIGPVDGEQYAEIKSPTLVGVICRAALHAAAPHVPPSATDTTTARKLLDLERLCPVINMARADPIQADGRAIFRNNAIVSKSGPTVRDVIDQLHAEIPA